VLLVNGKVLLSGGVDRTDHLDVVLAGAEIYDPATNRWSATGGLAIARQGHAAHALQDGRVVVAGGSAPGFLMPVQAELYDPSTGAWSPAGRLNEPRLSHALSLLPDGRLLVSGGAVTTRIEGQPRAEVYDPATNAWTAVAAMAEGRALHTSTALLNGRVLVVGGVEDEGPLASAEQFSPSLGTWSSAGRSNARPSASHTATLLRDGTLLQAGGEEGEQAIARSLRYDPVPDRWEVVGDMIDARARHAAAPLATGEVLVTGGRTSPLSTDPRLPTAELFDPATRQWRAAARMHKGRDRHTATALPDGRVLVVGGTEVGNIDLASAELYDRAADAWAAVGSMARTRAGHAAALLPDGKLLVTGGTSPEAAPTAEVFDAATLSWIGAASMSAGRWGHTATRLDNGKVLVVGGYGDQGVPLASAEIYDPASGTWSGAGAMSVGRAFHATTLLPDGTVLVSGGVDRDFAFPPLASTEIFDPATGAWTLQSPMNFGRVQHTSTRLPDGRVVVLGGGSGRFAPAAGVEFWSAGRVLAPGVPAPAARAGE
jgi:N-acetylneuraminic acid mutarotase